MKIISRRYIVMPNRANFSAGDVIPAGVFPDEQIERMHRRGRVSIVEEKTAVSDYSAMSSKELKALARDANISGYSRMTKRQLVEVLS